MALLTAFIAIDALDPGLAACLAVVPWGALHAVIPCEHSWPMLLPFVLGRGRLSPGVVVLLFGIGKLLGSATMGLLLGILGDRIPAEARELTLRLSGVVVLAFGIGFLVRPDWMHFGHVHGECAGACGHSRHNPRAFMKFGMVAGLLLLGFFNMILPCYSNFTAAVYAVNAGGVFRSLAVFLVYGFVSVVALAILMKLLSRSVALLGRLREHRVEIALLRLSGAVLVVFGVILLAVHHD